MESGWNVYVWLVGKTEIETGQTIGLHVAPGLSRGTTPEQPAGHGKDFRYRVTFINIERHL